MTATAETYFIKSEIHPGWIYDSYSDDFISPSGRTAPYPGAAFTGSVSKDELTAIKQIAEEEIVEKSPQKQEEKSVANNKNLQANIIKTIKLPNLTINWIVVE